MQRNISLALIAAALLLPHTPSHAVDATWLPTSGENSYTNPANWSSGSVPSGNSYNVVFTQTGDQTVLIGQSVSGPYDMSIRDTDGGVLHIVWTANTNGGVTTYSGLKLGEADGDQIVIRKTGSGTFSFRSNYGNTVIGGSSSGNTTVTVQGAGVVVGSYDQSLLVGRNSSSNGNVLKIESGAASISRLGFYAGYASSSNNLVQVTGSGSKIEVTNVNGKVYIGNGSSGSGNRIEVTDGASIIAPQIDIQGGTLFLNNGTVSLNHTAAGITLNGNKSRLEGSGTITAHSITSSTAGSVVRVGQTGTYGTLNVTLTGSGWVNDNISLQLAIGDLTDGEIAGSNYDFLNITGSFVAGGEVVIDLANFQIAEPIELQIISWTQLLGDAADLLVRFENGSSPVTYSIAADGLYIQSIPEPAFSLLGAAGLSLLWLRRRTQG